jgi:amino acid adenylation domain-containing protein
MARHFLALLEGALARLDAPLAELPLMEDEERAQTLLAAQGPKVARDPTDTLHGLIEHQVRRTPDAVALLYGDHRMSYRELDAAAARLASTLAARGVRPGVLVGVCMDRSTELVIGLLAILKAGGAYVPLDPEYPVERLRYMLADIAAPVVLGQGRHRTLLEELGAPAMYLDEPDAKAALAGINAPVVSATTNDVAYVIFTSGSTGRPKGCLLEHGAICNRLLWMQEAYGIGLGDRVLQKTPYSFDVSVWEFFWPLMTGATLVVAAPDGHRDPAYLVELIEREGVTVCHFVPSMLAAFTSALPAGRCTSLRHVFASGEALPAGLVEAVGRLLPARLHNLYGPTEAAVDVSFWECHPRADGRVPIGLPIANVALHVLDARLQPLPLGVPGELHIGGACLARGYLNQDKLTRSKFIPDPLSGEPGARLYKTGDLARRLPDGTIDYLGRIDHQVKLRGFRIELGEIEAVLAGHPRVRDAAVLLRDDAVGDKYLAAYVAFHAGEHVPVGELRRFLLAQLPEYMVPARFVALDAMPLTHSGKLDRKSLPDPETSAVAADAFVAPRDALEESIAAVWRSVLGVGRVGVHDDFFESGGHSLKVVTLLTRLKDELGLANLTQLDFHREPTIAAIATSASRPAETGRTLVPLLRAGAAATQLTLVCVPYAGASVAVYQPFADALCRAMPELVVRGVAIPGNELGAAPVVFDSFEQLAVACVEEIASVVDGPVALYGHCVGTFLALEIARLLELRSREVRFFVAGASFPFPRLVKLLPVRDPWRFTSDAKLARLIARWWTRRRARPGRPARADHQLPQGRAPRLSLRATARPLEARGADSERRERGRPADPRARRAASSLAHVVG